MLPSGLPEVEPVVTSPIHSLPNLRSLHSTLIQRYECDDLTVKPALGEILGFLDAAVALGEFLREPRLRESAQGMIDYWAAVLLSQAPQVAESPRSFRLKEFVKDVSPMAAETALVAQERSKEVAANANKITLEATEPELSCLRAILTRMIRLKASSLNVYTVPIPVQDDMFSSKVARTVLARLESGSVIREVKLDGEPAYTLTDENLVSVWDFLARVVGARKALREMARAWDRSERNVTGLLSSGQHLEDASTYRDLNTIEEEFVKASRIRKKRVQRAIIWTAAVVLVLVMGLLVFYLMQLSTLLKNAKAGWFEAEKKAAEVTEEAKAAQKEREKAEQANAQLRGLIEELKHTDTRVPSQAQELARCVNHLQQGNEFRKNGDLSSAEKAYNLARDCQKNLAEATNDGELWFQLSSTYNSLGSIRLAQQNYRGAFDAFNEALKIRNGLSDRANADERWKVGKFYSLLYLSDAARGFDQKQALSLAEDALKFAKAMAGVRADSDWSKAVTIAQEQVERLQSKKPT
jgi:tetratricopeptide (TPR) repeat protein